MNASDLCARVFIGDGGTGILIARLAMSNVLRLDKQLIALRMLSEGNSINSTARLVNIHRDTCTRLMVRFGEVCRLFLDREMRDLQLAEIQVDEMWTFCQKRDFASPGMNPMLPKLERFTSSWRSISEVA